MKYILVLLLTTTISLFAQTNDKYYIKYNGITLGIISDFSTINDGYLVAKPSNGFLGALLPFDYYIIYEPDKKPNIKGDTKYKKDKYLLLKLIRELRLEQPKYKVFTKNHYEMTINCTKGRCTYLRVNRKKNKSYKGYLTFINNILDEICDEESSICFKKVTK